MNLTYAIADLHGADDLLERVLAAIGAHAAAAPAGTRAAVFLGDYIDRGPGSRQIIARLMAGPPEGWRWTCLKGNHEDMAIQAGRDRSKWGWWIDNGGNTTLASYGPDAPALARHLAWAEALPTLAVDRFRVFVHAGVVPSRPLAEQVAHDLMWSRRPNRLGHEGRFVVHGHTPHPDGPVTDGRSIDLDTLAWRTGRLVAGVFDDEREGGPIDLIEVRRQAGDNPAA